MTFPTIVEEGIESIKTMLTLQRSSVALSFEV
jgi:hypothetical protein